MTYMINHPRVLSIVCPIVMWLMALLGVWLRVCLRVPEEEDRGNLGMVVSATLTLLGLIIGFTFSMAAGRYDQRKLFEESEANAIGTEYVRADLLPHADAAVIKQELSNYLDVRINFYRSDYGLKLTAADQQTAALQTQLWTSIKPLAAEQPTPIMALVVSGMNDVLNSQGYTQFAWWNRIPTSAWGLMIVIAVFANLLIGYATKRSRSGNLLLLVLPLIISVSFFLVSDIDSPRGGIIRVEPVDLISLSHSLQAPVR
jgi:hypothetical protein